MQRIFGIIPLRYALFFGEHMGISVGVSGAGHGPPLGIELSANLPGCHNMCFHIGRL